MSLKSTSEIINCLFDASDIFYKSLYSCLISRNEQIALLKFMNTLSSYFKLFSKIFTTK